MVERPKVCRRCNFRRLCFPRADDAQPVAALPVSVTADEPAASA